MTMHSEQLSVYKLSKGESTMTMHSEQLSVYKLSKGG